MVVSLGCGCGGEVGGLLIDQHGVLKLAVVGGTGHGVEGFLSGFEGSEVA